MKNVFKKTGVAILIALSISMLFLIGRFFGLANIIHTYQK